LKSFIYNFICKLIDCREELVIQLESKLKSGYSESSIPKVFVFDGQDVLFINFEMVFDTRTKGFYVDSYQLHIVIILVSVIKRPSVHAVEIVFVASIVFVLWLGIFKR
jgi:hypothetical protein